MPGTDEKVWLQLRIVEAFAHRMARARVLDRNVISSWDDLVGYCRTTMAHRETEQFRILFLDAKNVLVADEEQAKGTVNHVPVYPREVAKRALELNASSIILVHNHPSGDPTPSKADVEMTMRIETACEAIGVAIHDHIVVGRSREASFREMGLLASRAGCWVSTMDTSDKSLISFGIRSFVNRMEGIFAVPRGPATLPDG